MKKDIFKYILPHIIAVVVFALISLIYCSPLLNGNKLVTNNYTINELAENYNLKIDNSELWSSSAFSGLPSYSTSVPNQQNIFYKIFTWLSFGSIAPFGIIFWYMLGFYILLIVIRVNPWLSIAIVPVFALSSYFFVIIVDGFLLKAMAIGFIAPIIAGMYLSFERKKPWIGMLLMAFFMSLQISTGYIQITYYAIVIIFVYAICELVYAIRHKYAVRFFKTFGILITGIILSTGINSAYILSVGEYMPYSIYGKSELSVKNQTINNRKEYIDYTAGELLTLIIPNAKGGKTYSELSTKSATFEVIKQYYNDDIADDAAKIVPTYFGSFNKTSGSTYIGAVVLFLFILSLFIVTGKMKWWLLASVVVSILMTLFNGSDRLANFFLDYSLGGNRLETFTSPIVITIFSIALLVVLGIIELLKSEIDKKKLLNYFHIALGSTSVIVMIFIISPSIIDAKVETTAEKQYIDYYSSGFPAEPEYKNLIDEFKTILSNAIYSDRISMVKKDAARSLIFIVLGAGLVYLLIQKKLKNYIVTVALAGIILIDMWIVDKRYFNNSSFLSSEQIKELDRKSIALMSIDEEKTKNFRISNASTDILKDGETSEFYNSIGGNSMLPLRRYIELYDSIMLSEIYIAQYVTNAGNNNWLDDTIIQDLYNKQVKTPVLDMLNSRYFIYNSQKPAVRNYKALGNVWFVDDYVLVDNPNQELRHLKKFDTKTRAVISKQFQHQLEDFRFIKDSLAIINLIKSTSDYLEYKSNSSTDQLAVFSEIYYPKGWSVSIDGRKSNFFRANYILRAMLIPKGEHSIVFKFEPKSYKIGTIISYIFSVILLFFMTGAIYYYFRNKNLTNK